MALEFSPIYDATILAFSATGQTLHKIENNNYLEVNDINRGIFYHCCIETILHQAKLTTA
ncbi:hypothetical protein [Shewanella japonica]|uniref:hypothetical protein n=1 Tax=Shewanella japonica TaxID=93973 RepID=UPI001430926D|nr:hypothetical protein [Shewanella japonica]